MQDPKKKISGGLTPEDIEALQGEGFLLPEEVVPIKRKPAERVTPSDVFTGKASPLKPLVSEVSPAKPKFEQVADEAIAGAKRQEAAQQKRAERSTFTFTQPKDQRSYGEKLIEALPSTAAVGMPGKYVPDSYKDSKPTPNRRLGINQELPAEIFQLEAFDELRKDPGLMMNVQAATATPYYDRTPEQQKLVDDYFLPIFNKLSQKRSPEDIAYQKNLQRLEFQRSGGKKLAEITRPVSRWLSASPEEENATVDSVAQYYNSLYQGAHSMVAGLNIGTHLLVSKVAGESDEDATARMNTVLKRVEEDAKSMMTSPDISGFRYDLVQGIGSLIPFMVVSSATAGLGGMVGAEVSAASRALGAAGNVAKGVDAVTKFLRNAENMSMVGSSLGGAFSNAGSTYQEARGRGFSHQDAAEASVIGGLIGSLEVLGLGKTLAATGKFKGVVNGLKEIIEEGGQEGLAELLNNVNAKVLSGYDPARALSEGVAKATTIGAIIGGGVVAVKGVGEFVNYLVDKYSDSKLTFEGKVEESKFSPQLLADARKRAEDIRGGKETYGEAIVDAVYRGDVNAAKRIHYLELPNSNNYPGILLIDRSVDPFFTTMAGAEAANQLDSQFNLSTAEQEELDKAILDAADKGYSSFTFIPVSNNIFQDFTRKNRERSLIKALSGTFLHELVHKAQRTNDDRTNTLVKNFLNDPDVLYFKQMFEQGKGLGKFYAGKPIRDVLLMEVPAFYYTGEAKLRILPKKWFGLVENKEDAERLDRYMEKYTVLMHETGTLPKIIQHMEDFSTPERLEVFKNEMIVPAIGEQAYEQNLQIARTSAPVQAERSMRVLVSATPISSATVVLDKTAKSVIENPDLRFYHVAVEDFLLSRGFTGTAVQDLAQLADIVYGTNNSTPQNKHALALIDAIRFVDAELLKPGNTSLPKEALRQTRRYLEHLTDWYTYLNSPAPGPNGQTPSPRKMFKDSAFSEDLPSKPIGELESPSRVIEDIIEELADIEGVNLNAIKSARANKDLAEKLKAIRRIIGDKFKTADATTNILSAALKIEAAKKDGKRLTTDQYEDLSKDIQTSRNFLTKRKDMLRATGTTIAQAEFSILDTLINDLYDAYTGEIRRMAGIAPVVVSQVVRSEPLDIIKQLFAEAINNHPDDADAAFTALYEAIDNLSREERQLVATYLGISFTNTEGIAEGIDYTMAQLTPEGDVTGQETTDTSLPDDFEFDDSSESMTSVGEDVVEDTTVEPDPTPTPEETNKIVNTTIAAGIVAKEDEIISDVKEDEKEREQKEHLELTEFAKEELRKALELKDTTSVENFINRFNREIKLLKLALQIGDLEVDNIKEELEKRYANPYEATHFKSLIRFFGLAFPEPDAHEAKARELADKMLQLAKNSSKKKKTKWVDKEVSESTSTVKTLKERPKIPYSLFSRIEKGEIPVYYTFTPMRSREGYPSDLSQEEIDIIEAAVDLNNDYGLVEYWINKLAYHEPGPIQMILPADLRRAPGVTVPQSVINLIYWLQQAEQGIPVDQRESSAKLLGWEIAKPDLRKLVSLIAKITPETLEGFPKDQLAEMPNLEYVLGFVSLLQDELSKRPSVASAIILSTNPQARFSVEDRLRHETAHVVQRIIAQGLYAEGLDARKAGEKLVKRNQIEIANLHSADFSANPLIDKTLNSVEGATLLQKMGGPAARDIYISELVPYLIEGYDFDLTEDEQVELIRAYLMDIIGSESDIDVRERIAELFNFHEVFPARFAAKLEDLIGKRKVLTDEVIKRKVEDIIETPSDRADEGGTPSSGSTEGTSVVSSPEPVGPTGQRSETAGTESGAVESANVGTDTTGAPAPAGVTPPPPPTKPPTPPATPPAGEGDPKKRRVSQEEAFRMEDIPDDLTHQRMFNDILELFKQGIVITANSIKKNIEGTSKGRGIGATLAGKFARAFQLVYGEISIDGKTRNPSKQGLRYGKKPQRKRRTTAIADLPEQVSSKIVLEVINPDVLDEIAKRVIGEASNGEFKWDDKVSTFMNLARAITEYPDVVNNLVQEGIELDAGEMAKLAANSATNSGKTLEVYSELSKAFSKLIRTEGVQAAENAPASIRVKELIRLLNMSTYGVDRWQKITSLMKKFLLSAVSTAGLQFWTTSFRIIPQLMDQIFTGTLIGFRSEQGDFGLSGESRMKRVRESVYREMEATIYTLANFVPEGKLEIPAMRIKWIGETQGKVIMNLGLKSKLMDKIGRVNPSELIRGLKDVYPEIYSQLLGLESPIATDKDQDLAMAILFKTIQAMVQSNDARIQEQGRKAQVEFERFRKAMEFNRSYVGRFIKKLETRVLDRIFLKPLAWQEMLFRQPVFVGTLTSLLRREGLDLMELYREGRLEEIPKEVITKALADATFFTMAYNPSRNKGHIEAAAASFVSYMNRLSIFALESGTIFARAMFNAMKFAWEYSLLGGMSPLFGKDGFFPVSGGRDVINPITGLPTTVPLTSQETAANYERISKAVTGTILMGIAYGAYAAGGGGDEWWQIKAGKTKDGRQRYLDIRNAFPINFFMFIAHYLDRIESGTVGEKSISKDFKELFLGIDRVQRDTEDTLGMDLLEAMVELFGGKPYNKTGLEATTSFAGRFMSLPFTPLINFRNLFIAFSEAENRRPDYGRSGAGAAVIDKIPGRFFLFGEDGVKPLGLHPLHGRTMGGFLKWAENPVLAALGFRLREDSFAGQELSRLGLDVVRILPSDKDKDLNAAKLNTFGTIIEEIGKDLANDPTYRNSSVADQRLLWDKVTADAALEAKAQAEALYPESAQAKEVTEGYSLVEIKELGLDKIAEDILKAVKENRKRQVGIGIKPQTEQMEKVPAGATILDEEFEIVPKGAIILDEEFEIEKE